IVQMARAVACQIWRGIKRRHLRGDRIDPARWNDVAGERRADVGLAVRGESSGERVIDRHQRPGVVEEMRKISVQLLWEGERATLASRVVFAQSLERDHEERLVTAVN